MPELSSVQTDKVLVGRTEEDAPWSLPLISTVLAGSSGSQGSVMWAIVLALGPAVRIGLVELLGIDLKGGVEMKMAPKLFTRLATTAEEAVQLLEETVISMQRRLDEMGGVTRLHEPKVGAPAVVVVIDELAALTSYITDRDLKKRGEAALALILTMGRAPGFHVLAFVQDPRKEVLGMRQHFKQLFGLRLAEKEEVAMVLGEGAVARGAACHKIPPGKPGTGYVRGENGMITRVRAGFVTDAMLRQANELFRAPRQIPIIPPGPEVENLKPNRRPRKPRRKADEDQDETPLKNPGDCENPDDGEHPGRKPRRRRRPGTPVRTIPRSRHDYRRQHGECCGRCVDSGEVGLPGARGHERPLRPMASSWLGLRSGMQRSGCHGRVVRCMSCGIGVFGGCVDHRGSSSATGRAHGQGQVGAVAGTGGCCLGR